ncbi:hypothetical protein Pres01_40600 [Metapseudomonas resinovorans]|uniref:multinuclear nonheme iron-dependent oxidase n=1 Tax=Metapseudomonas resinovorans TaxID=53412 RepID=UPI0024A3BF60|nr:hypothetical protein Pres01_40600 [Pseudomonas resinovorans]
MTPIYASSRNQKFDSWQFIQALPKERIRKIHLAGHSDYGHYLIDTHDQQITGPVWDLYAWAIEHLGPRATLIKRDEIFPPLDESLSELGNARTVAAKTPETAACV